MVGGRASLQTSSPPASAETLMPSRLGSAGMEASSSAKVPRGWRITRDDWQDYRATRDESNDGITDSRFKLDLAADRGARAPRCGFALSKDAADRALERIIGHFNEESPRSAAQMKSWLRAKEVHGEVRAAIAELGYKHPETPTMDTSTAPADVEALSFFPKEWFRMLDEELLADLVVDSFIGAFTDAFVDGAIALADSTLGDPPPAQNTRRSIGGRASISSALSRASLSSTALGDGGGLGRNFAPGLAGSASEPGLLQDPKPFCPLETPLRTMPPADPRGGPSGEVSAFHRHANRGAGMAPDGFTMNGLPRNSHEAWTHSANFHQCKPLERYESRIRTAAKLQRPQRRLSYVRGRDDPTDQRKFVWPMTKSHLPEVWEEMTKPKRAPGRTRGAVDPSAESSSASSSLFTVDQSGRTNFPYSLVLHKAFLESQPDEKLKEKAKRAVPLKLTTSSEAMWK